MKARMRWGALVCAAFVGPAMAQSLATPAGGAPAPTPVTDAPSLERALQQADGPRRRILEAARGKAPAPAPAPAAAAPARAASAPAPAQSQAAAARPAAPARIAALQGAPAPLSEAPLALPAVAPLADAEPALPPAAEPDALAPPAPLSAPRLLSRVDPQLPARWLRRAGPRVELRLDFTINADGSVADVVAQPGAAADLTAAALEAVRQWRYEPPGRLRSHSVVLVIGFD